MNEEYVFGDKVEIVQDNDTTMIGIVRAIIYLPGSIMYRVTSGGYQYELYDFEIKKVKK